MKEDVRASSDEIPRFTLFFNGLGETQKGIGLQKKNPIFVEEN
jgi:hypothetical protein